MAFSSDESCGFQFYGGVGFDMSGNYFDLIWTDIGFSMQSINASAYLRLPFSVSDPALFTDLRLRLRYDDGFVAFLNGQEVARRNAPASLSWDSAATGAHGFPFPTNPTVQDFDNPGAAYLTHTFSGSFAPTVMPAEVGSM